MAIFSADLKDRKPTIPLNPIVILPNYIVIRIYAKGIIEKAVIGEGKVSLRN